MSYQHLLYAVEDRVATLTLNRPDRHNALSEGLMQELVAAVAQADADPEVRVLVLTGAGGKSFSSGYDLKELEDHPIEGAPNWRQRTQTDLRFTLSVWECSKPVIAKIDGYCFAGGLELAMCCDSRYCSEGSSFAAIEARFAAGISTLMMPWLIGQRCRALLYSGDTIDAAEAFRLGLVDKVFAKDALDAEVAKIAGRISRVSLDWLRLTKKSINNAFEIMGLRASLNAGQEASAMSFLLGSPEAERFNEIHRTQGFGAALRWRRDQFSPFE